MNRQQSSFRRRVEPDSGTDITGRRQATDRYCLSWTCQDTSGRQQGKGTSVKKEQASGVEHVSLWSLFWTFLKVGSTAFGGFMALISVVQNLIVERKKLLRHEDMLDGISLASLLPGPIAVNVVAYVGYRLRGAAGAAASALGVILPSFVLIVVLSYSYFRWGQVPAVSRLFMGFLPAVTAIILAAAWGMGRKAVSGWREAVIVAISAGLLLGVGGFYITIAIIFGSGVAGWLLFRAGQQPAAVSGAAPPVAAGGKITPKSKNRKNKKNKNRARKKGGLRAARSRFHSVSPLAAIPLLAFTPVLLAKLLLIFSGMSLMLFGGGYVFIPLIQEIVVDAIAMGQITPGPILIRAAFIGYKVAGLAGATVATAGIFLPPAVLMVLATRALEYIKKSSAIKAALRGVRPAVIGMIAAAAIVIAKTVPQTEVSLVIFLAALLALLKFRVEVVWVIPAAGLAGLLLY